MPARGPLEIRFWRNVDKTPGYGPCGDCWRWTGLRLRNGYGRIMVDGVRQGAHRAAYILRYGAIPPGPGYHGYCVCHACDVRDCVNPDHLFLADHAENVRDRDRKGRGAPGHTVSLRTRGERHPLSKLTEDDVRSIRADRRLYREIADEFGIHETTVCNLKRRHRWSHI